MGAALAYKGYPVLGAAKVLSRHSMVGAMEVPPEADHPDAEDDRMIEAPIETTADKLKKSIHRCWHHPFWSTRTNLCGIKWPRRASSRPRRVFSPKKY
jgi:hypothetical protein